MYIHWQSEISTIAIAAQECVMGAVEGNHHHCNDMALQNKAFTKTFTISNNFSRFQVLSRRTIGKSVYIQIHTYIPPIVQECSS